MLIRKGNRMKINQVVTEGLVGVTTQSHIKEKLEKLSKESKQKNIYLNRYVNFSCPLSNRQI